MNDNNIKRNSVTAWLLAARPKTLTGAAVPVMLGTALAYKYAGCEEFQILPTVLCFLFAWIMQIDSNLINDYFDCLKGNDESSTRLGPKRACSEGWISLKAMLVGIITTTIFGCVVGLPLVYFGGLSMIAVGALCVLFAFLYTTKLSSVGMGDVLVLLFFGIVPVCLSYYVIVPEHLQQIHLDIFIMGIACGLVIDTLLLVNNYRDRDNDKANGKITLVVIIGEKKTELLYLAVGIIAVIMVATIELLYISERITSFSASDSIHLLGIPLLIIYISLHVKTWKSMKDINHGKELNHILGLTARNIFIFGIITTVGLILS